MIKTIILAFRLARQGFTIESLTGTIDLLSQRLFESKQENLRLLAVLENIGSVHPIGGQRRMLAKKAIQDTPQPNPHSSPLS